MIERDGNTVWVSHNPDTPNDPGYPPTLIVSAPTPDYTPGVYYIGEAQRVMDVLTHCHPQTLERLAQLLREAGF